MIIKIYPFSNGGQYKLSKLYSLWDFFFPYGERRIRCESITSAMQENGIITVTERNFFTFRALFWTLLNELKNAFVDKEFWKLKFPEIDFNLNPDFVWNIGAVAYDTSTNATAAGSSTLSYSHTVTGTNPAIASNCQLGGGGTAINSVVYPSGSVLTSVTGSPHSTVGVTAAHDVRVRIACATGANNIIFTASSSCNIYGSSVSYSGVIQVGTGAGESEAVNTSSFSQTITTTLNNSWVVWGLAADNGYSVGAGANTTRRLDATTQALYILDRNVEVNSGTNVTLAGTCTDQKLDKIIFELSSASSSNIKTYNTNIKANIKTINTNAIANCKTLDTNA